MIGKCKNCGIEFTYQVDSHIKNTSNCGCGFLIVFVGLLFCLLFWPIGLFMALVGIIMCFTPDNKSVTMQARCYKCGTINHVPIR